MFLRPLVLSLLFVATISHGQDALRDAVECIPRDGVPNLRAKIEAGQSIKIGYLGGSITAAPGWRVGSLKWFNSQYPDASFEEINAAIGGTGSDLGVFRVQNDVLRHKPDLLFVEFAVNDGGAAPDRIQKAMEGIVRQTLKANPETDIIFVYTLQSNMLEDYQAGKLSRSATAMEAVADHYGIPSIAFGVKVVAMEAAGELVFKGEKAGPNVFSTDGVHPLVESGHPIYVETIERSWPSIWEAGKTPTTGGLPVALLENNWEQAKQVPITPEMLSGSWEKLPEDHKLNRFRKFLPEMHQATEPGATLSFEFDGISASVFDLVGPDGGQLEVLVDDRPVKLIKRIDGYCTYHRLSTATLASEIPKGHHKITVKLTAEQLDKREILFEKNRDDFDKNPEKYQPNLWTMGTLMVIGEVK